MNRIRIGYVRLCDAAPVIAAQALGSYARESVRVDLVALASWADARDRLFLGDIQAAHCLAGIPLAAQAGLFGPQAKLASAFTLSHHGNAITLATSVAGILKLGAHHFADYVRNRRREGRPLVLASVFPVSKHEYELRSWIASFGLEPDTDLRVIVVSPPETARAMRNGRIDGYCVGEPWNTRAAREGWGEIVATGAGSLLPGTDKVLAVHESFLDTEEHRALLRALDAAAEWLGHRANAEAAIELIAPYVGRSLDELRPAFTGRIGPAPSAERPFVRFDRAINRPELAHGRWYLEQMRAAGQLDEPGTDAIAARALRADVYDRCLTAA